jgi:uncharacterized protein (DUF362 family)
MKGDLSRREFIKQGAGAGAAIGLATLFPSWVQGLSQEEVSPRLVQVKGPVEEAVRKAVDLLGGMEAFVQKGQRVLLKPNASFAAPTEWGATTSAPVVRTVVEMCLEAGAKRVIVFDHTLRPPALCLEKTGLEAALKDLDEVKLVLPDKQRFFQKVDVPNGSALTQIEVAKEVLKADVIINLPTAKSHSATQVSLGMKNLMGLIWDRGYFHRGTDLHQAIAELSTVIQPDLIIMDLTRALLTGGPGGPGKVLKLDTIVAGLDPVAADAHLVRMAPWLNRTLTGEQVAHISAAHRLGLGEIDMDKVEVTKVELG